MMQRRIDDVGICRIMKAWPLIVSLVAIISAFVVMQTTLKAHSEVIQEGKIDRADLRMRLVRVETAIEMLPEMREDIKTLLRHSNKDREDH